MTFPINPNDFPDDTFEDLDTDELEALDEDELLDDEEDDSDDAIVPGNLDSLTGREDDVPDEDIIWPSGFEEDRPEELYRPDQ